MSDTIRPPRNRYIRKRKMLPFAYTDDGVSPWKYDTGISMEGDHGYAAKHIKRLRKQHKAVNDYNNGRARTFRKRQLRKLIQSELGECPEGLGGASGA
jgi:hypothetical protein